ncbi:hypothetical protein LOK49_Contig34G00013 [Camellia lanceoleosa]|nr:hypothetical protein LOK49_Contig34G00013 [Camellia lanceoleosa]
MVKSRLQIFKQNVEAILSTYMDILKKIDGNRPKEVIFKDIDSLLSQVPKEKEKNNKIREIKCNATHLHSGELKSVYVRNLPSTISVVDIELEFKTFGRILPDGVFIRNRKVQNPRANLRRKRQRKRENLEDGPNISW